MYHFPITNRLQKSTPNKPLKPVYASKPNKPNSIWGQMNKPLLLEQENTIQKKKTKAIQTICRYAKLINNIDWIELTDGLNWHSPRALSTNPSCAFISYPFDNSFGIRSQYPYRNATANLWKEWAEKKIWTKQKKKIKTFSHRLFIKSLMSINIYSYYLTSIDKSLGILYVI